jgi:hypothetical protein
VLFGQMMSRIDCLAVVHLFYVCFWRVSGIYYFFIALMKEFFLLFFWSLILSYTASHNRVSRPEQPEQPEPGLSRA